MANFAAKTAPGGLDAGRPRPRHRCPCPWAPAPSWIPLASHGRGLEGLPGPFPPPRHYQHDEIDYLLFVTNCRWLTHHFGNTVWEAGSSPPHLCLSWPGGTRAPQRRPCWPLAGWGSVSENKKKNHHSFFTKISI